MIDQSKLPLESLRGYDIQEQGDCLCLHIHRNVESLTGRVDWGRSLANACNQHYATVVVDLGDVMRVTSSFVSGLIHLRDALKPGRCILKGVGPRVWAVLQILGADRLFQIQQDPEVN